LAVCAVAFWLAISAALAGPMLTKVWTADEGLPASSVTSLAQTPDGYLWVGTYNGLARFDAMVTYCDESI